jgi:hypothetical protein
MSRPEAEFEDMGRYELKYVLPVAWRARVAELARGHVEPDPHAELLGPECWPAHTEPPPGELRGYVVHSLYYDTARLDDYKDRLAEAKVRHRLRARTYGFPGEKRAIFLEDKRKLDDRVIKSRVKLMHADLWCASRDPHPWRALMTEVKPHERLAARQFDKLVGDGARQPVSVVHYTREVWVGLRKDQPKVRLTLDHAITGSIAPQPWELYARPDIHLIPPEFMVMELKFDGLRPAWMREISRALGLRAEPVSKFGLSVLHGVRKSPPAEVRYLTPRTLRRLGHGVAQDRVEAAS